MPNLNRISLVFARNEAISFAKSNFKMTLEFLEFCGSYEPICEPFFAGFEFEEANFEIDLIFNKINPNRD